MLIKGQAEIQTRTGWRQNSHVLPPPHPGERQASDFQAAQGTADDRVVHSTPTPPGSQPPGIKAAMSQGPRGLRRGSGRGMVGELGRNSGGLKGPKGASERTGYDTLPKKEAQSSPKE